MENYVFSIFMLVMLFNYFFGIEYYIIILIISI